MIRKLISVLALIAALSLSGCAFLNSFDSNLAQRVDVWMKQHEYARILDTLQYVGPSNPEYVLLRKKRQQALAESKRYEQTQIARAMNLMEKGQWHEADKTLRTTLDKLPPSKALDRTYQDFITARDQHARGLYCQLHINRAEWLIMNQPVQEKLNNTVPGDSKVRSIIAEYNEDTARVYDELMACGNIASDQHNPELAVQTYKIAYRLKPDNSLKTSIARLQQEIDRKQASVQNGHATALSQLGRNLLEKSRKALAAGDLKMAISHYEKIPEADKQQPEVVTYDSDMNRRVHENVTQGIELGRKLYSQGQIEQALAVWKKLRDLDPDNDNLLNHIDRAKRVLDKIKQLRKEQSGHGGQASETAR